jgi:ubiquinol-cytochrome c reductase iron-sulfur subunit
VDRRAIVNRRADEWLVAGAFGVTTVAALALAVTYRRGGQPQLEGVFLAVALGGLCVGFVVWGRRLLPQGPDVEDRHELGSAEGDRPRFEADLERGAIERRTLILRMLGLAAAALGAAAVFPIRSLGPSPGRSLSRTAWSPGARLVNERGRPIRVDEVPIDSLVTVFPENHAGSADAQAVLIRVEPRRLHTRPGRETWAPLGILAYSKVCTHAGCPVGLYQSENHSLLCPCHQSAFDVLDGARPTFGPATRSLPQLPLAVDGAGFLVAQSDFTEPVGPGYWNRP